jgi:hypothetical protein
MEQDRLGMSIAHLGQGVELGIGWGSVGRSIGAGPLRPG